MWHICAPRHGTGLYGFCSVTASMPLKRLAGDSGQLDCVYLGGKKVKHTLYSCMILVLPVAEPGWSMAETVCRFTCERVNAAECNGASTRQIS